MDKTYVRAVFLALFMLLVGILSGCIGSGVSYREEDKCLIVAKNDAILSCYDIVIGAERQVDSVFLKKDREGSVRTTYFEVSNASNLSISEDDFQLHFTKGRFSLSSTNVIFVLTNQYDRCAFDDLNIACSNHKQIFIDDVRDGRITYIGHRDATHIIWVDVRRGDGQYAHVPLGVGGAANKETVLLTIKKREGCDYVIQENLYEFCVF